MSDKLSLPPRLFVAEGTDRKCFRHPDDENRCIKVLHPGKNARRFWQELRYYRRLQQRKVDFQHLTHYRGLVETDQGPGAIFDLVLDDDGRVSRSLRHYLELDDAGFNAWIIAEIERLKQYFYDYWIVFHDLNPGNILVRRLGYDEYSLVVIDGVGHNHLFPLASYSAGFARRKTARVWNRRYYQWYRAYPAVVREIKPYLTP